MAHPAKRAVTSLRGWWWARELQRQRTAFLAQVRGVERPYKLHMGCGRNVLPGWLNLDLEPAVDGVIAWDMRYRLPLEDGSAVLIHNEHFLEHLTPDEGLDFLRECRRLLAPDGVLRIAMPDLHELVRKYWEEDWRDQPVIKLHHLEWIKTRAEMINVGFRNWGHKWNYDREELHRRLEEAGFHRIEDAAWGESEHITLRKLETRPESKLICEASP